ncbi:MAG TPA: nucleotide sugar dehydrogenase, partial [Actinomycetota bacterium]|nr:nucleotide sugar dehydrogenase [Actinomycetota bacterium]
MGASATLTPTLGLLEKIASRDANVAVIGLGYVGLPLALHACAAGLRVFGLDDDPRRVARLQEGHTDIVDVDDELLGGAIDSVKLTVGGDPSVLANVDVVVICVPTPLADDLPDMSFVKAAAEQVAAHLRQGQLVILESTTYPGTTEEMLLPILETSGLKAGIDFSLGYSPERIDPGNPTAKLENVPKLIGGIDDRSVESMAAFYGLFIEKTVRVSSPRTAEMAKLLENTYRHVNIALVNEIAILCHDLGIDVWEVIAAASTKPFGFQPFYPGPGWGGHCIPVDPAYLSWRVRQMGSTARFVELAREFNEKMPRYVVERIDEVLLSNGKTLKGSSVLMIGVTYKADVADTRETPAVPIIEGLRKAGATTTFHDPLIASLETRHGTMQSIDLT